MAGTRSGRANSVESDRSADRAFLRIRGTLALGSVDDPRGMQLERGLAHSFEMRERQRRLLAQVND